MRFLTAISDRGGKEPYSDTNSPESLEMTIAAEPASPVSTEVTLFAPTGGTTLRMKNSSGVVTPVSPPGMGANFSNNRLAMVAASSKAYSAANSATFVSIYVPGPCTLTGIRVRKGTGTTAHNVIGALYNASGTQVAVSASTAAGTTASAAYNLAFSAGYVAAPGLYWAMIMGSATTGDYYGYAAAEYLGPTLQATQSSFAAPATFTPPALNTGNAIANTPFIVLFGTA